MAEYTIQQGLSALAAKEALLPQESTMDARRELGTPIAHKFCSDGRRATIMQYGDDKFVVTVGRAVKPTSIEQVPPVVEWEESAQVCSRESAEAVLNLLAN